MHAVSRLGGHAGRARDNGVVWHQADLLDPAAVRDLVDQVRPTHLLHLAWITTPGEYWESPENVRWVQSGIELVEAFIRCGGRRATFVGTCAEYDWHSGVCDEAKTPVLPRTLYGTSKRALETLAAARFRQCEIPFAWARLFFLFGPHESPSRLVPSTIKSLLAGENARCTAGHQIRDFLFVQDAADALGAVLDSDLIGPVNVASGEGVSLRSVVGEIADQMGRSDLVQLGALPTAPNDPPSLTANVSRLQSELGWSPRYGLKDGLRETIDWHRQQRNSVPSSGKSARSCPVCNSSQVETFLDRPNVMAHQNQLARSLAMKRAGV